MARRKQVAPSHRSDSSEVMKSLLDEPQILANGSIHTNTKSTTVSQSRGSYIQLFVCVGGIYAAFLTWALLQERITKTPYAPLPTTFRRKTDTSVEYFRFPIFLNTIQALFAFVSGSLYTLSTIGWSNVLPSRVAVVPLLLITLTTTLASPFGYIALSHVDYLTFVLAKSCKLLPVMALHVTLFRKRYPMSKYIIVLAVTAGVAIFTLYNPPKPGRAREAKRSSMYGLGLLAINLILDGLTNTVQDHVFANPVRYGKLKGPQVMAITNAFGAALMGAYLFLTPYIPGEYLPTMAQGATHEMSSAVAFLQRHPSVLKDVLGFAACGAVGQLFIFETLARFSSLLLVTVTVTRKMLTMVLSVVWYGKSLTLHQWGGVGLVFAGIGSEAYINKLEKEKKIKTR